MKKEPAVLAPSRWERFTLRFLIITGLAGMGVFVFNLTSRSIISSLPLYILFMTALGFTLLKVLFEWYHYFFITVKPAPKNSRTFTVDIFTTFCAGEPYEMIVETLNALNAITYPHTTYLCDEANDPYLKAVCEKLGIRHVSRKDKTGAKAGNINNALQFSDGELCVVLDPDHVPNPDFLDPIVGHFNDEKVGFVQIVQAYKNYNDGLIAKGAAQQTFQFYGPMMMTMNAYGTVQAIGANCTFRRTALESIGGHAAGLAEDMHTSMQLHAKGWKSVYVPMVLARGLVPNTLSAYYKQQLKWARGVFDLFFTVYIKLFNKFTWRQKLHYALTPVYYLSGIIILINFLIPVIALVFGLMPLKTDLSVFCLSGLPFIVSILLIRQFVQKWVMDDDERGFHVVGGLLMIGTWWIFILGLFYTVTGKKVPYDPTPKDGREENNWPLNIPNIAVFIASFFAIIYGLYKDWNPYAFVMAGLAGLNCFFMVFLVAASRQNEFRKYKAGHSHLNVAMQHVSGLKRGLWIFRRRVYDGIRWAALPLFLIFAVGLGTVIYQHDRNKLNAMATAGKQKLFLTGIFYPQKGNGLTELHSVSNLERSKQTRFDLVSLYQSWGDGVKSAAPLRLMRDIYRKGNIPIITWEPWQNLFNAHKGADREVFKNILSGSYDAYIRSYARQLRDLDRPVFLRFAHEADNPMYPWSAVGNNTPEDFRNAWKYVHKIFEKEAAFNVIWVWNPWKPEAAKTYFPGEKYVDWIGVDILDYASQQPDGRSYSFSQLYQPFRKSEVFRKGLPVMVAEIGSLLPENKKAAWLKHALDTIQTRFKEIKAVVFFNSRIDQNVVIKSAQLTLDWTIDHTDFTPPNFQSVPRASIASLGFARKKSVPELPSALFSGLRGVNYSKGSNWRETLYPVNKSDIDADFATMKAYGINTVKIYGPSLYDRNLLSSLQDHHLNAQYAFWVPERLVFDSKEADNLINKIVETVEDKQNHPEIINWHIANPVINRLEAFFDKPVLLDRQQAYIHWLKKLVSAIKRVDPVRPVTVDVELAANTGRYLAMLNFQIANIDAYGLIADKPLSDSTEIRTFNVPVFYSSISAENYLSKTDRYKSFLANWRDEATNGYVALDGLLDFEGRMKHSTNKLLAKWGGKTGSGQFADIGILRPATTLFPGDEQTYHALLNKNGNWVIADKEKNIQFEWYLIRTDRYKNKIGLTKLKNSPAVTFSIPENPDIHRIYLIAVSAGKVRVEDVPLNLLLYQREK